MYYKVFADGWMIDIIYARTGCEAIQFAILRHGSGAVWNYRAY